MAADENANSTKELHNVKTVRPISTNFGMKNSVATVYILWYSKNDFTTKMEELERAQFEQVRQYFNIAKGQLGGVLEISANDATACDLLARQRWKADIIL